MTSSDRPDDAGTTPAPTAERTEDTLAHPLTAATVGTDPVGRRCFGDGDPLYERYHDEEWGTPVHGDRALYERMSLEAFQSGLAWITVLRKRPGFRAAFADFDPEVVAGYDEHDVERLMADAAIIRNRAKITATIANARALLDLQAAGGSLDALFWSAASPRPESERPRTFADVPATTDASTALAKRLKRHGFRFVGPTTAYAAMQACGMVDDHLADCPVITTRLAHQRLTT